MALPCPALPCPALHCTVYVLILSWPTLLKECWHKHWLKDRAESGLIFTTLAVKERNGRESKYLFVLAAGRLKIEQGIVYRQLVSTPELSKL